ncbi:hypothetical protein ACRQ5Q_24370 [Bradyrhizobium sp. PMVTL-01]
MVALQRLQADGRTWYTLKTFDSANAAYLWLGKWNAKKYRLVRA